MTWPALAEQTAADTVAVFGEPVRLAKSGREVIGVFCPHGRPGRPAGWDSTAGSVLEGPARRGSPMLQLRDADAVDVVLQDLIELAAATACEWTSYEVTGIEADGFGMTWLELALPFGPNP